MIPLLPWVGAVGATVATRDIEGTGPSRDLLSGPPVVPTGTGVAACRVPVETGGGFLFSMIFYVVAPPWLRFYTAFETRLSFGLGITIEASFLYEWQASTFKARFAFKGNGATDETGYFVNDGGLFAAFGTRFNIFAWEEATFDAGNNYLLQDEVDYYVQVRHVTRVDDRAARVVLGRSTCGSYYAGTGTRLRGSTNCTTATRTTFITYNDFGCVRLRFLRAYVALYLLRYDFTLAFGASFLYFGLYFRGSYLDATSLGLLGFGGLLVVFIDFIGISTFGGGLDSFGAMFKRSVFGFKASTIRGLYSVAKYIGGETYYIVGYICRYVVRYEEGGLWGTILWFIALGSPLDAIGLFGRLAQIVGAGVMRASYAGKRGGTFLAMYGVSRAPAGL